MDLFYQSRRAAGVCPLPVSYFFPLLISQFMCFRQLHKSNPSLPVASFGSTTSTSNLRKHLYNEHLEQWVTSCDTLDIKITAQAAIPAVKAFRQEPVDTDLESKRPKYSKETFVEAIVEFIVGDDQVCAYFLIS
jgi:hypothetical protein